MRKTKLVYLATGKVRENLEKYGYHGAGELFRPHLTFTEFTGEQSIDANTLPAQKSFPSQFITLGSFE